MTPVFAIALALLSVAGLLTLMRLVHGPGALNRIIALDVTVTLLLAGVAVDAARRGEGSGVPLLLVLAVLGFVGSVTAAHLVEEREGVR
ncbi:hypothetical protein GCM10023347_48940 [Streptomyces chumphonensis]|uniref:Sodium:proton antiporter n=1 Tax=Streptomyces chumphonensis TaxID=1214925 RepID=A0A927F2S3_9ACTN|nr:monovalent cation/H+ antiporter complex subunit F [Streptomyces chumphonensis]MBD3933261.1 sodium:proton antiporter [Streptomyces chumphonensis]